LYSDPLGALSRLPQSAWTSPAFKVHPQGCGVPLPLTQKVSRVLRASSHQISIRFDSSLRLSRSQIRFASPLQRCVLAPFGLPAAFHRSNAPREKAPGCSQLNSGFASSSLTGPHTFTACFVSSSDASLIKASPHQLHRLRTSRSESVSS